jgi:imidazolonepropionase
MRELPLIEDAYLIVENGRISSFGAMNRIPNVDVETIIDASNKVVLPTWVDSHTHVVYAADRVQEFVDRINGLSYQEIANRGGGILNSVKLLNEIDENVLYNEAAKRLTKLINLGTGAIEIKSGYGLSLESELKMLRVINRLKENFSIPVKATFLGAHAVPERFKNDKAAYVNEIINDMIPKVAEENLAEYIDVFCEKGYFDLEDTHKILEAGRKYNLIPKIHVNQFNAFGGVAMGVKHNALSVDHLEELNQSDLEALKDSNTIPVALPSCSYFLGIPYTPARQIIDSGLPLSLASDYNPGSTPSGNMNFVVSTACIKMKMTPEEAINAATLNGAYAIGLSRDYGSITIGKKANLIITKEIPNYQYLPYAFGEKNIDSVIINGKVI